MTCLTDVNASAANRTNKVSRVRVWLMCLSTLWARAGRYLLSLFFVIVMQSGADGSHSVDKWEYLQPENGALTPLLCFVIWLCSECTAAALLDARWTHTHTAAILSVSPQVHSSC